MLPAIIEAVQGLLQTSPPYSLLNDELKKQLSNTLFIQHPWTLLTTPAYGRQYETLKQKSILIIEVDIFVSCFRGQVSRVRYPMSDVRCQVSCVRCHVSGVRYHVSGVTCHLSHVTNPTAKATNLPCYLPQYAQQDSAADLDLEPKINCFQHGNFWLFLSQNCKFWDQCHVMTCL